MSETGQEPVDRDPRSFDETLRLALEVAQLGFWDHDIVNDSVYRSPEWGGMLGYAPEEIEGRRDFWLEHVHPDDRPIVDRSIRDHEAGLQLSFRIEHRLRTKDGGWKWILNWGRVVERDEKGNPLRALGFHLDISERKQAEEALARVDKMSTIGTLAGGIAHDFNNLLTAIRGNLQLAREIPEAELKDHYLANAERATRRSQELTNRLLTFAKGGAPKLEAVNLEGVLAEARDLVLSGSNSRVVLECSTELPLVAGCRGQIAQVFQNLFLNADQAMPDGGVISVSCSTITIEQPIERVLYTGDYVETIVSDEGVGIPADVVSRVFDPFFSTRTEGKGLGLSVAHSIINDHSGLLEVLPSKERGARIRVLIPVATEEQIRSHPPVDSAPARTPSRVLVVDDDQLVRELASTVIQGMGHQVAEADDGAMAVELYEAAQADGRPFGAVLMDLTIPGGMGGKEAVALILEKDPNARVIVSSGYSDNPVIARYRDYGFCACLTKPYELQEVRSILNEVMNLGTDSDLEQRR